MRICIIIICLLGGFIVQAQNDFQPFATPELENGKYYADVWVNPVPDNYAKVEAYKTIPKVKVVPEEMVWDSIEYVVEEREVGAGDMDYDSVVVEVPARTETVRLPIGERYFFAGYRKTETQSWYMPSMMTAMEMKPQVETLPVLVGAKMGRADFYIPVVIPPSGPFVKTIKVPAHKKVVYKYKNQAVATEIRVKRKLAYIKYQVNQPRHETIENEPMKLSGYTVVRSVGKKKKVEVYPLKGTQAIDELKTALKRKGYDVGRGDDLDQTTKNSLVQFQLDNGLPIGQLDLKTADKLYKK